MQHHLTDFPWISLLGAPWCGTTTNKGCFLPRRKKQKNWSEAKRSSVRSKPIFVVTQFSLLFTLVTKTVEQTRRLYLSKPGDNNRQKRWATQKKNTTSCWTWKKITGQVYRQQVYTHRGPSSLPTALVFDYARSSSHAHTPWKGYKEALGIGLVGCNFRPPQGKRSFTSSFCSKGGGEDGGVEEKG